MLGLLQRDHYGPAVCQFIFGGSGRRCWSWRPNFKTKLPVTTEYSLGLRLLAWRFSRAHSRKSLADQDNKFIIKPSQTSILRKTKTIFPGNVSLMVVSRYESWTATQEQILGRKVSKTHHKKVLLWSFMVTTCNHETPVKKEFNKQMMKEMVVWAESAKVARSSSQTLVWQ